MKFSFFLNILSTHSMYYFLNHSYINKLKKQNPCNSLHKQILINFPPNNIFSLFSLKRNKLCCSCPRQVQHDNNFENLYEFKKDINSFVVIALRIFRSTTISIFYSKRRLSFWFGRESLQYQSLQCLPIRIFQPIFL